MIQSMADYAFKEISIMIVLHWEVRNVRVGQAKATDNGVDSKAGQNIERFHQGVSHLQSRQSMSKKQLQVSEQDFWIRTLKSYQENHM